MLLAQDVLHAYTMISISIMVVFTSLTAWGGREKQNKDRRGRNTKWTRCFGWKRCWDVNAVCSFLLGHCLDDKDIFASHRLLDLYPRFYGNKQDVRREAAGMQANQTQTPLCVCYLLITKPPWPVSFTRGLSVPFVPGCVKICYPWGCIFALCFVLLATRRDKPQHELLKWEPTENWSPVGRNNEWCRSYPSRLVFGYDLLYPKTSLLNIKIQILWEANSRACHFLRVRIFVEHMHKLPQHSDAAETLPRLPRW